MQLPLRIALLSAKGGCGRSTVAINLAYLLAAAGRRVALVDLAQFGSLSVLLQIPERPGKGLGPVAACVTSAHRTELIDVVDAALDSCNLGGHAVAVMTAAPPPRQDDLTVAELLAVLQTLAKNGYDLVLDSSHELSDRLAAVLHAATHRIWVLSPDPAAGWLMLQMLDVARALSAPDVPSGVILNRFHRRCGLTPFGLQAAVGLPVCGVLPDLPGLLPLAAHQSTPLVAHRFGRWRRELQRVIEDVGVVHKSGLFASWWPRWDQRRSADVKV